MFFRGSISIIYYPHWTIHFRTRVIGGPVALMETVVRSNDCRYALAVVYFRKGESPGSRSHPQRRRKVQKSYTTCCEGAEKVNINLYVDVMFEQKYLYDIIL
jgi:hypothetical protein